MTRILAMACITFLSLISVPLAHGAGVGISMSGSLSDTALKQAGGSGSAPSTSITEYFAGAGIVVDSAVARDTLFNYRFNLSYKNAIIDGVSFFDRQSFHRLLWTNTFGLGFYRTESARIFAGPQLALSYEFAYNAQSESSGIDTPFMMGYLGLVLGFNAHAGKNFTFCFEIGARAGYGGLLENSSVRITRLEPFATIAFIGRIGDTFGGEQSKMKIEMEPI